MGKKKVVLSKKADNQVTTSYQNFSLGELQEFFKAAEVGGTVDPDSVRQCRGSPVDASRLLKIPIFRNEPQKR